MAKTPSFTEHPQVPVSQEYPVALCSECPSWIPGQSVTPQVPAPGKGLMTQALSSHHPGVPFPKTLGD